jgi:DNA-binding CsgD family transcriptional regulator/GAF domain-containing protein
MALQERVSPSAARDAYRSVKRACYAGYDSVTLRREVVRRAAPALGVEASVITTTDPDTGLATHAVGERVDREMVREYYQVIYPSREVEQTIALARDGPGVTSLGAERGAALGDFYSPEFRELVHQHGLASDMRAALTAQGQLWGMWYNLRDGTSPPFTDGERGFLRAIAPHLARGLSAAALLRRADEDEEGEARAAPGVLVIDARRRVAVRNAPAAEHLADLADAWPGGQGIESLAVPAAVGALAGMLAARLASTPAAAGAAPLSAELRARGRSGRWYLLRASLTEPDGSGESATVVVVEPVARGDVAPVLARLYGLSSREREVLAGVARGLTKREIAARLGLSPYTVQDHLDHAFEKVGVRGRRALLDKLFFDGYAPRLLADEPAARLRPTAARPS